MEEEEKISIIKKVLGALKTLLVKAIKVPIFAFLVLLILIGAIFLVIKVNPSIIGLSRGQEEIDRENEKLLKAVGKLIELPQDEQPTIATVTDVERVKDQLFFTQAQNGDRVIIYTEANKAILYRPSENKIIEVGAVNVAQPTTTATPIPEEEVENDEEESLSPTPTESPIPTP